MAAKIHKLGPGLVTIGATPLDFSCEVVGATVTHEYEEVSEAVTRLCGDSLPGTETRQDGFTAELHNDITETGLYAYLYQNDMTDQPFEYTPNTEVGTTTPAVWSGTIRLRLPSEIGADEFGSPIGSEIEWLAVGPLVFAPGVDTAPTAGAKTKAPA